MMQSVTPNKTTTGTKKLNKDSSKISIQRFKSLTNEEETPTGSITNKILD